mmetsp:Transcript_36733/g.93901  ORF Transcript_36733/g.93901 Transcript_36733/m.93901 type:complete len:280 (+) Transcript_36733:170-1009(+)
MRRQHNAVLLHSRADGCRTAHRVRQPLRLGRAAEGNGVDPSALQHLSLRRSVLRPEAMPGQVGIGAHRIRPRLLQRRQKGGHHAGLSQVALHRWHRTEDPRPGSLPAPLQLARQAHGAGLRGLNMARDAVPPQLLGIRPERATARPRPHNGGRRLLRASVHQAETAEDAVEAVGRHKGNVRVVLQVGQQRVQRCDGGCIVQRGDGHSRRPHGLRTRVYEAPCELGCVLPRCCYHYSSATERQVLRQSKRVSRPIHLPHRTRSNVRPPSGRSTWSRTPSE